MPSPRRRPKPYRGLLTQAERRYLLTGHPTGFMDEPTARAAWMEHRASVYADAQDPLVPWAAIRFDGIAGCCSPYCRLGDPACHPSEDR
jgi:hypothetical protein